MAQPFIQASFNSGEWAPHLWSRTDQEKYHSGAALLRNFFVDYRGGASTRQGSRYIIRCINDDKPVRVIPFQASITVAFALEFGEKTLRFHRNGAAVTEAALVISAASQGGRVQVTTTTNHGYSVGDVVEIVQVVGMTQLNNRYMVVHSVVSPTIVSLDTVLGNAVNSTAYTAYVSGGTISRVYTIATPYSATDLALLKYNQNINTLILTHPAYDTEALQFISTHNWTLTPIVFGTTVTAPGGIGGSSTLGAGGFNYAYVVTSVDNTGQESNASAILRLGPVEDMTRAVGSNLITWSAVAGAQYYNVYKAVPGYNIAVSDTAQFGYIGNTVGVSFVDTNIGADFSETPPIAYNPFATGYKVTSISVSSGGTYTATPTVSLSAPIAGGTTATATPVLVAKSVTSIAFAGGGYAVLDTITLIDGVVLTVTAIDPASGNSIVSAIVTSPGTTTSVPVNPQPQVSTSGGGTLGSFNLNWKVDTINVINGGSGYDQPGDIPTVTFAPASTAHAVATLAVASLGPPGVSAFFQQRLCLAGVTAKPNTAYLSRPGQYYNYDISLPTVGNDSITAPIVSGQLANIKSMIPQPGGLIILTDGVSYLLNGGSLGSAITPDDDTANPQSFIGANDMPPIVVNFDILFVQAKGSGVRDSTYNFYANVFTGSDISVISSHLFFGYQLLEWAWAEEPYKLVWAVRNDGVLLSLTFIKEQEFIAWAHHDTNGSYKSVCTIVEAASVGYQNFTYLVVERNIGGQTVKFMEFFDERPVTTNPQDYWTVDCCNNVLGPATAFYGFEFLGLKTVTGLADGVPITPFNMPANGEFTLAAPVTHLKLGMAFTPQLQTLYLDIAGSQGTVQSKEKKINACALRVTNTLGLSCGTSEALAKPMKDLIVGNVGRMTNQRVTALVTGDAFAFMDPLWQEQGQVFIEQPLPYPATILGYIPQVAVGDSNAHGA